MFKSQSCVPNREVINIFIIKKNIYPYFHLWRNSGLKKKKHFKKLVKPEVSEAEAIPQIYADFIQHKGLFKYYITHF